jgi:transposase
MQIQDTRSLSLQEKEFIRKRAVYSVINDKLKQKDVARMYKVSVVSVCNWVKAYRQNGSVSLKNKSHGRPSETVSKLNKKQSSYIVKLIIDKTPDQLKFPFMLWTRQAVKQLIKREFNIILSLPTISRYLKKWGFTPQRPVYKAIERDTKKVVKFLQEEYPFIKQKAKQEKAEIHWGDESGFRTDHTFGRSYGLKGKTPVVNKTGKRLKCNMMSTVANNGTMRFMIYEGSMDSKMFIKFLTKLIYKRDKKIFLILDNLRTHHSNKVKDWVEKRKDKIELFFLPPYSPELNPDELLNQDVKSNAYKHKLIHSTKELKKLFILI